MFVHILSACVYGCTHVQLCVCKECTVDVKDLLLFGVLSDMRRPALNDTYCLVFQVTTYTTDLLSYIFFLITLLLHYIISPRCNTSCLCHKTKSQFYSTIGQHAGPCKRTSVILSSTANITAHDRLLMLSVLSGWVYICF